MPRFQYSYRSLIAAAAFAFGICGCSNSTQSSDPVDPGSRYTVEFPGMPSCAKEEVNVPWGKSQREICSYFDEKVGRGYSAELANLPVGSINSPAAEVLLAAASGAASSTDSIIFAKNFSRIGDLVVLDVTLVPRANGYVAFSRYILEKNELFTFTADGYTAREMPPDASAFLLSARVSP